MKRMVISLILFFNVCALWANDVLVQTQKALFLNSQESILNVFKFDLNRDFQSDFVLSIGNKDKKSPSSLRCLLNGRDEKFYDFSKQCFPLIQTIHARNIVGVDFLSNGNLDLIVADHGSDVPPFPGGKSLFLKSSNNKNKLFLDFTDKIFAQLPSKYTFNISADDVNGDGAIDFIFNNYFKNKQEIELFISQKNQKYKSDNSFLPLNDARMNKCFLFSTFADLDNNFTNELILGGCDSLDQKIFSPNDLILTKNNKNIFQISDNNLPIRNAKSTGWGSNNIKAIDLNGDSKKDLVVLMHDSKQESGLIKVYLNQGHLQFKEMKASYPILKDKHLFFISDIELEDVNNDQYPDMLFSLRDHSKLENVKECLFLLLNDKQGSFRDVSSQLPVERKCYSGAFVLKNPSMKFVEMILFSFNGEIKSFKIPEFK